MSSTTPEPEFLDQAPEAPRKSRTKAYVLSGVAALAVGAVGVGAWGVAQLMGGGPGAAVALPADTLFYAAIDLDPSAEQKIEAFRTIRKFPALEEELNLRSKDDIRSWVVDLVTSQGECEGLDYSDDVEPWLGEKAAAALVEADDVTPVFALQVTDEGKAEQGIAAIFEHCSDDEDFGTAFIDDYMIVAPTDGVARDVVSDAKKANLADDSGYQDAIDTVGDQGIVSLYVAKDGPAALFDAFVGEFAGDDPDKASEQLKKELADFKGLAGTLRFDGGGVELAFAGTGLPQTLAGESRRTSVHDLPASTIAALGVALPDSWVDKLETQLRSTLGPELYDQGIAEAESATGLALPEDLEKLLGKGLVLAVDGGTDFDSLVEDGDLEQLKAGIRVEASEDDVRRIVGALQTLLGVPPGEDFVKVAADGDRVAVGFDQAYLDDLLEGGDLGADDTFGTAVREAEKSSVVLFVDFDAADDWLVKFVDDVSGGDDEAVDNVRPLDALGMSAWTVGDAGHFLLRLSTD